MGVISLKKTDREAKQSRDGGKKEGRTGGRSELGIGK